MIAYDHRSTSFATASAFALGLLFCAQAPAAAFVEAPPAAPVTVAAPLTGAPASSDASKEFLISLNCDGHVSVVFSSAATVGAFLAAANVHVTQADYVSEPLEAALADGMDIVYRASKIFTIRDGSRNLEVRSNAATVADVIADAGLTLGQHDATVPALHASLAPADVISIRRTTIWTVRKHMAIRQNIKMRPSEALATGQVRTVDPGTPGLRETTTRLVRGGDGRLVKTLLASRIIRAPRARIVERGVAVYASLATAAERGFSSAMHFAGSALKMIATAYTASCYGCSGYTASGAHAGLGVIAVDPNIIPLGTRLFIPGYGKAVAGDTGGAIRGHRIDLGMNTLADAMRFGRRPVTVYVLR